MLLVDFCHVRKLAFVCVCFCFTKERRWLLAGPELAGVDRFGESFLCHQTCCWFYLQPCVGGDVMGLNNALLLEFIYFLFSG